GPQEVTVPLVHRHDVLVVDEGDHPLLLAPYPGAIGVSVPAIPLVEELHPRRRRPGAEGVQVVLDLEEVAAGRTAVDDFEQAVLPGAAVDAAEPGPVAHGPPSIAPGRRPGP